MQDYALLAVISVVMSALFFVLDRRIERDLERYERDPADSAGHADPHALTQPGTVVPDSSDQTVSRGSRSRRRERTRRAA